MLEREFEVSDVRAAVAEAIRPKPGHKLGAHRILLDLATSRSGVTRLVTTNFDLLFEECDPNLKSSGPPRLPDPKSERDFAGVVHLHGRVDPNYQHAQDDEFVISSADFGRAYLSDGWATRFIQTLLARFQIVFVGYTADDPPVQYLLEALNLRAGSRTRLYAFQSGEQSVAAALWEHRGVRAISFDDSNGFGRLWNTLGAWAERARDIDAWYDRLLSGAAAGPEKLDPHERGQIAHVLSTREGARRTVLAKEPLNAKWLLVFDPRQRYGATGPENIASTDPFTSLRLDSDTVPEPPDPSRRYSERKVPEDSLDVLEPNLLDREDLGERSFGAVRGQFANQSASLSQRLNYFGVWLQQVAHQPTTLWWAAHQVALHPQIKRAIGSSLLHDSKRYSEPLRREWRFLLAKWADEREDPNLKQFEIEIRSRQDGWTPALVREFAYMHRPQIEVWPAFGLPHPLLWAVDKAPERVVGVGIKYPCPHEGLTAPDNQLSYAVSLFRENLELAIVLEREVRGNDRLPFQTSRADDGDPELPNDSYGLTGLIVHFQKLMGRYAAVDRDGARAEVQRWSTTDEYIFARLRIWAAGSKFLAPGGAGAIFLGLSDRVFWDRFHERDLLYALRDGWTGISQGDRVALERRLLTGGYPYETNIDPSIRNGTIAYFRLNRLHWLSSHGVEFSFDVAATIASLRAAAPDWRPADGDAAADSLVPVVTSVEVDVSPQAILDTPIPQILPRSRQAGQFDIRERVQREPFRGLTVQRPARALGALTHVGRAGEAPPWAWSDFLRAEARLTDRTRMIVVIAARLKRLPVQSLREIIYPVADWMERIAERLYSDAAIALSDLWNRMIQTLELDEEKARHRPEDNWADDALNAPVGRLVNLLMKDPKNGHLQRGVGYPRYWTDRLDQLLALPGEKRRHALVMVGHQLAWLFTIDPMWTKTQILPAAGNLERDGDALWDGILWAARMSKELFFELKPALVERTWHSKRLRFHTRVISQFLLVAWRGDGNPETADKEITDIEFREVLIHCSDELRRQVLWHIGRYLKDNSGIWRRLVVPFLKNVWPKQRALHTPSLSGRLADIALVSGDLMPTVVELVLPRLVPVRGASALIWLNEVSEDSVALKHPRATLDLLWAILAEDPTLWPHRIGRVLDFLTRKPETMSDARLSELKRRQER